MRLPNRQIKITVNISAYTVIMFELNMRRYTRRYSLLWQFVMYTVNKSVNLTKYIIGMAISVLEIRIRNWWGIF